VILIVDPRGENRPATSRYRAAIRPPMVRLRGGQYFRNVTSLAAACSRRASVTYGQYGARSLSLSFCRALSARLPRRTWPLTCPYREQLANGFYFVRQPRRSASVPRLGPRSARRSFPAAFGIRSISSQSRLAHRASTIVITLRGRPFFPDADLYPKTVFGRC